ncbi:putative quinol monooxygenase [Corallincola spongiicola]|uniref:Antibiotic biosynthesis monooxygenase n=1 Tax=Corallincola spongiicola TaxID=2520508 RepID=A0ABY1WPL1_9GAMM|nr:antibiotic biosynthesis monooxygenase [Corallincola spongiicola]TAA46028.1 antibiotic biosynthesis monooxygenase [Corallincola spongiicola]
MSKIILKGYILVPEAELDLVKNALVLHRELTLEEPGCMVFSVTQSLRVPNRFDVYEEFTDSAAFEFHQSRVKASYWGQVSTNVERHYELIE